MILNRLCLVGCLAVTSGCTGPQPQPVATSSAVQGAKPEALLAAAMEAAGGRERLAAIKTLRLTGVEQKAVGPGSPPLKQSFSLLAVRPRGVRVRWGGSPLLPRPAVQVMLDGRAYNLSGPRRVAMVPAAARHLHEILWRVAPLVLLNAAAHNVRRGMDPSPTPAVKPGHVAVTVNPPDLSPMTLVLDQQTSTLQEIRSVARSGDLRIERLSDYREVAGVQVPHRIEVSLGPQRWTTRYTEVELNPKVVVADLLAFSPQGPAVSVPAAALPRSRLPHPAPRRGLAVRRRPIVAVLRLKDTTRKLGRQAVDNLTDILGTELVRLDAFRVIPRSSLRRHLQGQKREGYRDCYDRSCQIELGKALAAEKIVTTTLMKVGGRCVLTAALYDLKSETSVGGATMKTRCRQPALFDGIKAVAKQLAGAR